MGRPAFFIVGSSIARDCSYARPFTIHDTSGTFAAMGDWLNWWARERGGIGIQIDENEDVGAYKSTPDQRPSGTQDNRKENYEVFISFKNLMPNGQPTRDSALAREVNDYLSRKGFAVFLSNVSLERLGTSAYKKAIDDALDVAQVLVAVGTSRDNLEWRWVRYEWDSFFNDILSGVKPTARVFAYVEGMRILDLPRSLRQAQTFTHADGSMAALANFIANALEKSPAVASPQPIPKHERPLNPPEVKRPTSRYDVFFVYSYADRGYVNELSKELNRNGLAWTENTMMADPPEVARMLKESHLVVFIDSDNAKGAALYQELDVARGMAKPIVAIRIEQSPPRKPDDILRFVETIQHVDATRMTVSEVARELGKVAGKIVGG